MSKLKKENDELRNESNEIRKERDMLSTKLQEKLVEFEKQKTALEKEKRKMEKKMQKVMEENLRRRLKDIDASIQNQLSIYPKIEHETIEIYNLYMTEMETIIEEHKNSNHFTEEINDPNILNLVLIGATGVGKSMFACRLAGDKTEECTGGSFEHGDSIESVTQDIYKQISRKGATGWSYDISIIDTPGIYDTGGKDREHANDLIKYLKGCGGVNAFLFVKTKNPPRFDDATRSVLDKLEHLLGEPFWKHTIFVLTNSNRKVAESYKLQLQNKCREQIKKTAEEAPLPVICIDSFDNYEKPIHELIQVTPRERYMCDQLRSPLEELIEKNKETVLNLEDKQEELTNLKTEIKVLNDEYQKTEKELTANIPSYKLKPIDLSLIKKSEAQWEEMQKRKQMIDEQKDRLEEEKFEVIPEIFITNPVIVNIGISQYEEENDLEESAKDITTMNNLWNLYGYNCIYDNIDKPNLTQDEFWQIMNKAKEQFADKSNNHDSFIISFSGHGDKENIYCSDFDGDNGKINIHDLQK
eukprot:312622_1